MKISAVLGRSRGQQPGVTGVARVDRRVDALLRRACPGDIAVLDQVDLDRKTADALVTAGVAGVVNAAPSISGRFPNLGPEILVDAGVVLVDDAGADALRIKDGAPGAAAPGRGVLPGPGAGSRHRTERRLRRRSAGRGQGRAVRPA